MRPRIVIPTCSKSVGLFGNQCVQDKYVDAVVHAAGGFPVVLACPFVSSDEMLEQILAESDGVLLTGSPSNIEPHHYSGPVYEGTEYDPTRDALTLELTRRAVDRGIPVFGICRGFQEMNVALGGSLHQRVHESGFTEHRGFGETGEAVYAPAHEVTLLEGSGLRQLIGRDRVQVNSIHSQGVDRLAPGCVAEAAADDGLIEAFVVRASQSFALAVQWHPEWQWRNNETSQKLFRSFGDAARQHRASRS